MNWVVLIVTKVSTYNSIRIPMFVTIVITKNLQYIGIWLSNHIFKWILSNTIKDFRLELCIISWGDWILPSPLSTRFRCLNCYYSIPHIFHSIVNGSIKYNINQRNLWQISQRYCKFLRWYSNLMIKHISESIPVISI